MGRHFVALEDHELGADEWLGTGGPLKISVHPSGNPLCEAVLNAAEELGTPRVADVNHVDTVAHGGMGYQTTTTWKGRRFSAARAFLSPIRDRSEEHTSELQSLMRISYAVFCLKKKNKNTLRHTDTTQHSKTDINQLNI